MKKLHLLSMLSTFLLLSVLGYSQVPCNGVSNPLTGACVEVTLTDSIYWDAQPQELVALAQIPDIAGRESQAQVLAAKGFSVDRQIMIWGWDPVRVMASRLGLGYLWVPAVGQANLINPLHLPGFDSNYDPNRPWPGSIKVSVSASDYPSKAVLADPTLPKFVGPYIGNGMYAATASVQRDGKYLFSDGGTVIEGGKSYAFHLAFGPFGPSVWFIEVKQ